MMSVGLLVTMGIGSSFGTVPVLAAIFVPMAAAIGFSPLATAALIGASRSDRRCRLPSLRQHAGADLGPQCG